MTKFAWILLFAVFFLLGLSPLKESDTFMYLALAKHLFTNGHLPSTDPYIFPMENTLWKVSSEWGGYVYYYAFYAVAGFTGLTLAKITAAGAAWAVPVRLAWRHVPDSIVHFMLFLLGLVAFGMRYSERASLLGDAFLLLTTAIVIFDWKGVARIRWLIPLIALIWANIHPSFPLLWAIGFIWLVAHPSHVSKRAPAFGLSIAAPFLNPEGWRGVAYPFRFLEDQSQFLKKINLEWMPPFSEELLVFDEPYFFAVFLALAGIFFALSARQNFSRETVPYYALSLFFLGLGLWLNRFISASVLGLCLLSVTLPNSWRPRIPGGPGLMSAVSFGLILSLLTGTYTRTGFSHELGTGIDYRMFPSSTLEKLKTLPERGPVWNSYYVGSYLAWELREKKKIFIHSFVIDEKIYQRYFDNLPEDREHFDQFTRQYNINEMLVHKEIRSVGFLKLLANHPNWEMSAQDDTSILFERR